MSEREALAEVVRWMWRVHSSACPSSTEVECPSQFSSAVMFHFDDSDVMNFSVPVY